MRYKSLIATIIGIISFTGCAVKPHTVVCGQNYFNDNGKCVKYEAKKLGTVTSVFCMKKNKKKECTKEKLGVSLASGLTISTEQNLKSGENYKTGDIIEIIVK